MNDQTTPAPETTPAAGRLFDDPQGGFQRSFASLQEWQDAYSDELAELWTENARQAMARRKEKGNECQPR